MSGSRKWMKYVTDSGATYAVNIDESNGEAGDFDDITLLDSIAGVIPPTLPKGFKMRRANLQTGENKRTIPVGKPDSGILLGTVASILLPIFESGGLFGQAVSFAVRSVIGETSSITRATYQDTGLTDGDES